MRMWPAAFSRCTAALKERRIFKRCCISSASLVRGATRRAPNGGDFSENVSVAGPGYANSKPEGGSVFESTVLEKPYSEWIANLPVDPDDYPAYCDGYAPADFAQEEIGFLEDDLYYCGLINPEFIPADSAHKNIGYVRLADTDFSDPFRAMFDPDYSPEGMSDNLAPQAGRMAFFAAVLKYFNEQNVTKIIFDIRVNTGGQDSFYIASLIGGNRRGQDLLISYQDRDDRPLWNSSTDGANTLAVQGRPTNLNRETKPFFNFRESVNVAEAAQFFPDSIFRNGEVVILTSTQSFSGGDLFPQYFQGDNWDGEIGSIDDDKNVSAKIVGNVDGRLRGSTVNNGRLVVSKDANEFVDADGNPVRWFGMRNDGLSGTMVSGRGANVRAQWNGKPIPFMQPAGGPLSDDLLDTVYPDLGQTAPYPDVNRVPNKGQPIKENPLTWRDTWLEEAILR